MKRRILFLSIYLLALFPLLSFGGGQQYSVAPSYAAGKYSVRWTAPANHDLRDVITIVSGGVPIASAEVPVGASGEVNITVPGGRYRVQYRLGGLDGQAVADVVYDSTPGVEIPPPSPTPEIPPIEQGGVIDQPRLRQLRYFENGVLMWTTETLDETEAARHLTNLSLSPRSGVLARIEVRYATVNYPELPDEVGTWKK